MRTRKIKNRSNEPAALNASQAKVARSGLKAMMPVGRPFIDYVLSGLADAGYCHVCLVIGPGHGTLRDHVSKFSGGRLTIDFAIQPKPLGTANAVAAAADFAANDSFLLINGDNDYPASALGGLRLLAGASVAAFRPAGLCRGNIPRERLRQYAILSAGAGGFLSRVLEKPDGASLSRDQNAYFIGMNCWRFTPLIFEACRAISPSARNEYELTDAVAYSIDKCGERFEMLIVDEPVLDLSTPADVAEVTRRLASVEVRL